MTSAARIAAGLLALVAAGIAPGSAIATPAAPAASAPVGGASAGGASSPQWGAPVASPNAAADDDDGRATGEYFHDFAALMLRLRGVGWIADICSETFPADAELEHRAYDDWMRTHRAFVDEMEGQFALIDRRWATASPSAASQGITAAALRARLDAYRVALREDFLARPVVVQRKRCDAYPTLLLSRKLDVERSESDLVRSVRQGPPAP